MDMLHSSSKAAANRLAVFCDLDGTLLDHNGEITPFTKAALHRFAGLGHLIVFTTARSKRLGGIGDILREISGAFILHNGGEILWDGQTVAVHYFTAVEARRIGAALTASNVRAAVILEHDYYANYDAPSVWGEIRGFRRTDFSDLNQPVPKFSLYFPDKNPSVFPNGLLDEGRLEITDQGAAGVFMPNCVSKGAAIREFVNFAGLNGFTTIAIGNDKNDLSAFAVCDITVAAANAEQEILDAADVLTLSNDEDGVAHYLLSLIDGME